MNDGKDGNTKGREPVRDEIELRGHSVKRLAFVSEAAMQFAAATESSEVGSMLDQPRSVWACDAAEALWTELCKRFPEAP